MGNCYVNRNINLKNARVGDCTVRAIGLALGQDWETTYIGIALCGLEKSDMPTANNVWGAYLRKKGYRRFFVDDMDKERYTVEDFCKDHPSGVFVLALESHVVAVIDGFYHDTWDCGDEPPLYYWTRLEED